MHEINELLRQLDDGGDLPSIRAQIINLIFNDIHCRRDSLDTWERMHFANAIGSLALNVDSMQLPRKGWLRLCLSDLRQAKTPKADRHSNFVVRDMYGEEMSAERLLNELASIARRIEPDE